MTKIIDIKTRNEVDTNKELKMVHQWELLADMYLGDKSCAIYHDSTKGLAFISKDHATAVALIEIAYKMLVEKGLIVETRKSGSGFCGKLFYGLRNMFSHT